MFASQEEKRSTVQMDKVICSSKYNVISSNQDSHPSDNREETIHHMDSNYVHTGNQLDDKCLMNYKGISSDILDEDATQEEKMYGTLQMDKDYAQIITMSLILIRIVIFVIIKKKLLS
jgi:hypothetical protein